MARLEYDDKLAEDQFNNNDTKQRKLPGTDPKSFGEYDRSDKNDTKDTRTKIRDPYKWPNGEQPDN